MDADRFDTLTRFVMTTGGRRAVLCSLVRASVGGPLVVLRLAGADQAAAKKKKPCPPCKKRKKGKCKGTLPDGTGCSGGTCQSGSCVPTAPSSPPPPPASFCAGKNDCVTPGVATCHASGGTQCYCWIKNGTLEHVCGTDILDSRNSCALCLPSEICIITGVAPCPGDFRCVSPCPNPR